MEATHPQQRDQGGAGWERYATCKSMVRFGDVSTPDSNQLSLNKTTDQDPGNKTNRNMVKSPIADAPRPNDSSRSAGPACAGSVSHKDNQPLFGKPSPLHHGPKDPLWVHADVGTAEAAPHPEPSLEDLYKDHPEKKLRGSFDPATMNFAANVIIHVVNEACYRWLRRWCPRMGLREVFESIGDGDKNSGLVGKLYNVSPEAIDKHKMTATLAEMYRRCHNAHPKVSGDIQFPKLLKLIDECVLFLGAVKEKKYKTLLQKTRSMFQWIPIGLDAKTLSILKQARIELEELNGLYKHRIVNTKADCDNLNQKRREDELSILDAAIKRFDIHRETFEKEILDWLHSLLASTNDLAPKLNLPEAH